jgi:predicted Rossmann fold nucleotide-binding protein DprA/Smf involved in DNA uptake|tara:strand:+ start:433 stop:621 length:189 start_codon:yes stop_codon:yes gene_type:complete
MVIEGDSLRISFVDGNPRILVQRGDRETSILVRGCHELIQNGEKLGESSEDIREELSKKYSN